MNFTDEQKKEIKKNIRETMKAKIQTLNERIRQMEQEVGSTLSASTVSAGIQYYKEILIAWYKSIGFHNASITVDSYWIHADFSYELNDDDRTPLIISNKELFKAMKQHCNSDFLPNNESVDVDYEPGSGRLCLVDTDANRCIIHNLFKKYLPGSTVRGFSSQLGHDIYFLRFQVYVPFSALETLRDNI